MEIIYSPHRAINYAAYDYPRELIRSMNITDVISVALCTASTARGLPYSKIYRPLVVHNTIISIPLHDFISKYFDCV